MNDLYKTLNYHAIFLLKILQWFPVALRTSTSIYNLYWGPRSYIILTVIDI